MMTLSGCVSLITDWMQVGNAETSSGVQNRGLLCHVDSLSDADTDRLVECLRLTPEVALSLVYTNGYSQLREPTDTKVSLELFCQILATCSLLHQGAIQVLRNPVAGWEGVTIP